MPLLTLVDTNGSEYYIVCNKLPPRGGSGTLEIPGVKWQQIGAPTQYALVIPIQRTKPSGHALEMKIDLVNKLDVDDMVLPYDGGVPNPPDPQNMMTIKTK